MSRAPSSIRAILARAAVGQRPQARPAAHGAQPGHVRRRDRERAGHDPRITDPSVFAWLIAAWLWFTVLFANFAEAMAEGRGKAQAEELRRTRAETVAHRRARAGRRGRPVPAAARRRQVVVAAGEIIPADGDVIEGIASVDESAITGESAPVIRESGGDRSAVTGGTRVLSDRSSCASRRSPGRASSTG